MHNTLLFSPLELSQTNEASYSPTHISPNPDRSGCGRSKRFTSCKHPLLPDGATRLRAGYAQLRCDGAGEQHQIQLSK